MMAHFYGYFQGSGQEITRTGTANSGIRATLAGWNIGTQMRLREQVIDSVRKDVLDIFIDGGSGVDQDRVTFSFTWDENGVLIQLPPYTEVKHADA